MQYWSIQTTTLTIGRGSITVQLTSCLICLDLAALLMLNEPQFYLFGQLQSSQTGGQPCSDASPYGECSLIHPMGEYKRQGLIVYLSNVFCFDLRPVADDIKAPKCSGVLYFQSKQTNDHLNTKGRGPPIKSNERFHNRICQHNRRTLDKEKGTFEP